MSNVVKMRPPTEETPTAEECEAAIGGAVKLLECTIDSIRNHDGEADLCHLTTIERINVLLWRVCAGGQDVDKQIGPALDALSLVELARYALETGPEGFNWTGRLNHGLVIAAALEAALDRLEHGDAGTR